ENRPLVYFLAMGLTESQRASWEENGFFIERGFADQETTDAMIERIVEIARANAAGESRPDLFITPDKTNENPATPEVGVSKIFRVMRAEPVFHEFATNTGLLSMMGDLIGPDVDCFLSQFIFKHPGTLGQPWHQDDYYFRMTPLPQVGVWLACTAATMDNGPLWVVPGSNAEPIHDAVPDTREGAGLAYVEIVDVATDNEQVVLMEPGDLLVFHSHLRHRSTDNLTDRMRAAMVYHYAAANSEGYLAFNQDWTEVLRDGQPVQASTEPVPIEY
ncbi:MAG: phytanoyl-CoA dioxygenase family protein, partial [bacterium]|nr:phytanoyl-CoA dioxygenase family protein [bacterium]